ncbi:hypothetical protein ABLE91_23845 [Aquabacter sp. CN5-332]|uniref:hypothetical protein n=1 Tax=Aquabacter sp. CN5-332 TaxID=3156608 RepID=UPI0032B3E8B3
MRYLAIAPLAVAAAMSFSTLAMADEYTTAQNKEDYAVSALSAQIAQEHGAAPLGFAAAPSRASAVNAIYAAPTVSQADALELHLGDRGLGGN